MQPFVSRDNAGPKFLNYQQDSCLSCTYNQYAPFSLSEGKERLEEPSQLKAKGIKAGLSRGQEE